MVSISGFHPLYISRICVSVPVPILSWLVSELALTRRREVLLHCYCLPYIFGYFYAFILPSKHFILLELIWGVLTSLWYQSFPSESAACLSICSEFVFNPPTRLYRFLYVGPASFLGNPFLTLLSLLPMELALCFHFDVFLVKTEESAWFCIFILHPRTLSICLHSDKCFCFSLLLHVFLLSVSLLETLGFSRYTII